MEASITRFAVTGIPSEHVDRLRRGGPDANGQRLIVRRAETRANPCRHCLQHIKAGDEKLVLSYRPFDTVQPYAETGPIFLHRTACQRYESEHLPTWFAHLQPALIRGYDHEDWIRYDTGQVVPGAELASVCEKLLNDTTVAYIHIRSKFNCFQCRVDRDCHGTASSAQT